MEKRYFKIHDLCYGLDGLIAEVSDGNTSSDLTRCVNRLINSNIIVGDRQLILPVADGGLLIKNSFLTEVENPDVTREFGSDNPYGECVSEATLGFDCVSVNVATFKKAMLVTIRDKSTDPFRTLFSEYFSEIEMPLCSDILTKEKDLDNMIFHFKKIIADRRKK